MLFKPTRTKAGVITALQVKHTGLRPAQNFSRRFVEDGVAGGYMVLGEGTLTVKAKPEDLNYAVTRQPGYYCRSTGQRIPISAMAWASPSRDRLACAEAQKWLASQGLEATDYEVTNAYECVLNDKQHAKYRGVPGEAGYFVAANTLKE